MTPHPQIHLVYKANSDLFQIYKVKVKSVYKIEYAIADKRGKLAIHIKKMGKIAIIPLSKNKVFVGFLYSHLYLYYICIYICIVFVYAFTLNVLFCCCVEVFVVVSCSFMYL